jgi:L-serine dehydratase
MRKYSSFDILGPVMIGPSSSHTAGAARLGKIAGAIGGDDIIGVKFLLHGSFAKTYKGHGTDRALVAGVLGMEPWDERLRDSLKLAEGMGLKVEFREADFGDVHPNTVRIIMAKADGSTTSIRGSSIGGGSIVINEVDGEEVEFTGEYPTVIIKHIDMPGVISKVTTLMYEEGINIAFMKVYRSSKGASSMMVFETDTMVSDEFAYKISNMSLKVKEFAYIKSVRVINPVKEGE